MLNGSSLYGALTSLRGKAAIDSLIAGYQVWAPVFEALEDLGYNESTLVRCVASSGASAHRLPDVAYAEGVFTGTM